MIALIAGIIAGFVLSIPPGPVAAFAIQSTLTGGKRNGLSIALGVAVVDMIFCLLVVFASTALLGQLESIVAEHPYISFGTKAIIVLGIIIYGILQFRKPELGADSHPRIHLEEKVHSSKPFIVGSATALSNAFNPTFLPSLTALISAITSQIPNSPNPLADKLFFVIGFGAGTYGWFHSLASFVHRHHAKISPQTMLLIRRIGALVLIGFAVYLGITICM